MNDNRLIESWSLQRGATKVGPDGGVRFSVWAPLARRVDVLLNNAERRVFQLQECEDGVFTATVSEAHVGTEYTYMLDGGRAYPDPVSRSQPHGVHGTSRVVDPSAFAWTDASWTGIPMPEYVIYELHVGTFTSEGTFDSAIPHLAALRSLGVTAIELMPVAQFPGDRNWGYDGTFPYASQNTYGGPDGLQRLVDAAHAADLAVVLDVVYNHLGPEGNYLGAFAPYFSDVYRTPWGGAMNYDGADSDNVRRYIIDNALQWTIDFHIDGLRLDAVHRIYDSSAKHVLAELTEAIHHAGARQGRHLCVIAESDSNDPRIVRTVADSGLGFDAAWSDDLHHAVHAALTGEATGYYRDFGAVSDVASALREPFVYAGQYSRYRKRRHGGSSVGISRDRFVVCIQDHDQVGNRARGERLSALVPPARARLAAALLLLSPYVPMLFMGEEYGATSPFYYFVSHGDAELVDAVRRGRRAEFEAFGWGDAVPDPAAVDTYLESKLDRTAMREPAHVARLALYRDLLALRANEPALRPGNASISVAMLDSPDDTADRERHSDGKDLIMLTLSAEDGRGRTLLAAFNFTGQEAVARLPANDADYELLLNTSSERYADPSERHKCAQAIKSPLVNAGAAVLLPWSASLFRQRAPR